jgi:tRNA (guanine-N7-)-methyltransferase
LDEQKESAAMRTFPIEFESKKEILFYPGKPERCDGDILEIGPGRGDFLLSLAPLHPEKRIVAIELGRRRYRRLIPRLERRGISNILLIQGDARIVLPRYYQPGTFGWIYVLFPDPWPKKRHIPHRLLTTEFISLLAGFLRPSGELYITTDVATYAEWVVENARQVGDLTNLGTPHFVPTDEVAFYSPTFFEQKWRNEGRPIYYMRFRKS